MDHPRLSSPATRQGRAVDLLIPTREQVAEAAKAIPQAPVRFLEHGGLDLGGSTRMYHSDGPRTYLTIHAGAIQIQRKDLGRSSRTREAALRRHAQEEMAASAQHRAWLNTPMALLDSDAEQSAARARFRELAEQAGYGITGKARGKVTCWSRASRARMELTLRSLDYSPLFDGGRRPVMLTLTLPGYGWMQLAATPRDYSRMVTAFTREYARCWGEPMRGPHKMEFQSRGAAHTHALPVRPDGLSRGRSHSRLGDQLAWTPDGHLVSMNTGGLRFEDWASLTWAKIVCGPEGRKLAQLWPWSAEGARHEFEKHVRAGTGVDEVEDRYRDPKRIAQYFSKHGAYASKEYQNQMPAYWLRALEGDAQGAQFWGVWGLERARYQVELNEVPGRASSVAYDTSAEQISYVSYLAGLCAAGRLSPLVPVQLAGRLLLDDAPAREWARRSLSASESWRREHVSRWSTDRSVLRAASRDTRESLSSDAVKVERHMRKLARAMAARTVGGIIQQKVNKRGQLVTDMRIRVIRGYRVVDKATGEVQRTKDYRVGYYTGGGGFLSVNDGRRAAADITRLLGGTPGWSPDAFELRA